jgi:DNA-binding response OmpR family regulator
MSDKKILVIEDDADVRLGYQVVLKANNYATCFAADAMCAISEARKQQPDLIILDLGLPAGDGWIVLEKLQASTQLAVIPVIVVSGRQLPGNKALALRSGAKAFLQKPWDDEELLALIEQQVGRVPFPTAAR